MTKKRRGRGQRAASIPPPSGQEHNEPAADHSQLAPGFELLIETKPTGLIRRFFTTQRHFLGLLGGGLIAHVRASREDGKQGLGVLITRFWALVARPFIDRTLREQPFPVQLRRRLEILGPTYIKLGQVLSLREDILPRSITEELKNLLDRLPVVPFPRYLELIAEDLRRSPGEMFAWIDPRPTGSASIAQIHRARTHDGDEVILKVVKPGIKETLERDTVLLRILGTILQWILPRFQPRRVLREFSDYTLREVDLRREADNAETFAANFKDEPDIRFPRIWREFSGPSVLTMEFFDGSKPSVKLAETMSLADREKLIDLGAQGIIRMLFKDGFFHADLHPGNLIVLPGPKIGFIDLGMIGRFDEELRRSMMYYYFCLVTGDAASAARYLSVIAQPGPGGDTQAFRRAVEEVCRRWARSANFKDFSLAQLIMQSVAMGVTYRMYFPVEMVLMVKALVTFEGVGQLLNPGFDVAAVSQRHINTLFLNQFNPLRLMRESLRGAPDVVDALVRSPLLITEGLRFLEQTTKRPQENPFAGLNRTLMAGFSLVAGAIVASFKGPWPVWVALFGLAFILVLARRR
ncbi:MAG: AarF/UbiB family protein [Acidobacteriota bacterium]